MTEASGGLAPAHQDMMRVNELNWDARTSVHIASRYYGLEEGKAPDPSRWFAPFEWDDLGELKDLDVLHLQCHLGTETIAFAQRGARTVGLDISGDAIDAARDLATRAAIPVEYVHANVYDAPRALEGRQFDIIYTGKGALYYLPDLNAWAKAITQLLRPGGKLYIAEFHPLLNALRPRPHDGDGPDLVGHHYEAEELVIGHDYLANGTIQRESTHTYTDGPALEGSTEFFEWMHGLDDVINAVIGAGLRVEALRETHQLPWRRWHRMESTPDGWWQLPANEPRIPLLYALLARK
ncbi:class I SAM-dependent methyltransferase [Streptomyces albiflavescens]|nr:class I SAM-dependent methyltransferase [Streptomyces albiflavescens]